GADERIAGRRTDGRGRRLIVDVDGDTGGRELIDGETVGRQAADDVLAVLRELAAGEAVRPGGAGGTRGRQGGGVVDGSGTGNESGAVPVEVLEWPGLNVLDGHSHEGDDGNGRARGAGDLWEAGVAGERIVGWRRDGRGWSAELEGTEIHGAVEDA